MKSQNNDFFNDQSLQEWWDALNEMWKSIFLLNHFLNKKGVSPQNAKERFKIGVNPFAHYEYRYGSKFIQQEVNEDVIKEVLNLGFIYAAECDLEDITPLKWLKELTFIDLCLNKIKSIDILADHDKIRMLYLQENYLESLPLLEKAQNIEELLLRENRIKDISNIGILTTLKFLDIGFNRIPDIHIIGNLTELEELQCDTNFFNDITVLGNLKQLKVLELSNNKLLGIEVLLDLPALKYVGLSNAEVPEGDQIEELIKKGVDVAR